MLLEQSRLGSGAETRAPADIGSELKFVLM